MLETLSKKNKREIYSLQNEKFAPYGRVLHGYDFSELEPYMQNTAQMPDAGNIYEASVPEMEKTNIYGIVSSTIYGQMPIEIGYCNGKNSFLNGFEYHKGSEINVAMTPQVLILGHVWQINENKFNTQDVKIFYIPSGTAIELYSTTLHLAPCKVDDDGFRTVVILPKGTNFPLDERIQSADDENQLLLMRNKWVLAHPENQNMLKRGAVAGLVGENIEILY